LISATALRQNIISPRRLRGFPIRAADHITSTITANESGHGDHVSWHRPDAVG
jgi:hypothetical protein